MPPAAFLNLSSLGTAPEDILQAVFDVSPTGVALLQPVFAEGGTEVIDFQYIYLNPAAQRLLGQPERPGILQAATPLATLAFFRDTFLSGQAGSQEVEYQHNGFSTRLQLAARRSGELLVLSLADAAGQTPSALALALHASQQREQAAQAEADRQRQHLHSVLEEAPAMICLFAGPQHTFEFVNQPYQALVGDRPLVGKPIAEAMPELAGQPIFSLLDHVYQTGETFYASEMLVQLDHHNEGRHELEKRYYNFIYQARRAGLGAITGIFVFAYDVTGQVQARQQVALQEERTNQLNEELAAANEEMQATNEEINASNLELLTIQTELRHLNQELEARVADRTVALTAALQQTERQRELLREQEQHLQQILGQVPASVATLAGPGHHYTFFNTSYQQATSNRAQLGLPMAELFPEMVAQGFIDLLDEVYATGQPRMGFEMPTRLHTSATGRFEQRYIDFIYQPLRNAQGQTQGILEFILDVTDRVLSRRQAEAAQAEALAAAEQLATQRETFYRIFEQTPAAVAILRGAEHQLDYFNPAYQQLFPERLVRGRTVAELQPEAVAYGFLDLLHRVYQTGETYVGYERQLAIEQANGQPPRDMYFDFTYQPFQEEGQMAGISVFAYDVTERVLARQASERQRTTLNLLFMAAPSAICIYAGPDQVYELVNPAYQRIFPGRELLGRPFLEALPELAGTPALASLRHVYHTGETLVAQEMPLQVARHAAGPLEDAFFTFTYQARRNADGVIDGILVFAFEVTDQVRARQVVEKSEQYLRRMADNVPAMIWLTDTEGQCIYLNQQWYDYTAQTEAEGMGMGWLSAVHPDDMAAASTIFLDASARHASFSVLYRLRRHDGRYRWAIDSGQPRFNRAGQFDGFVGTVFDIHEQKQAEQALQRLTTNLRTARDRAQILNTELQVSNEQLRRSNVDLDNFIYTASHDLKAPITNIEGLLHHLREQLPDALTLDAAPLLTMMQDSIERFQRTLEHLSDVTKLQKEHDQPVTQVALAAVVADVQLDLRPLLEATGAEVAVELSACPAVSFSAKNLRSVVYNLLSNALKYRDPARPAQVRLSCHPEDGYLVLTVQDNGLGLDAGQQAELFTMFRRFHTGIEGSGVGLYMVKKIVENAGGKLFVESTLGVGSTFSVYFRR